MHTTNKALCCSMKHNQKERKKAYNASPHTADIVIVVPVKKHSGQVVRRGWGVLQQKPNNEVIYNLPCLQRRGILCLSLQDF